MVEGEPGALLEALAVLVRFRAEQAAPTLRRALAELIETPDRTTPSTREETDGAAMDLASSTLPSAAPPPVAARTARRLPGKAAPRAGSASNRSGQLTVSQWAGLRREVQAEMRRQGVDLAGLARRIGYSFSTVRNNMWRKRSPPSAPMTARLRDFVAAGGPRSRSNGGGGVVEPATTEGDRGTGNGQATTTAGDEAKTLAVRLRAKRRPLPLTGTTLAGQIGCTADELDDALRGRPVPRPAAERLAAWAAR